MPTNKPRFTIVIDDELYQKVNDYRYTYRLRSQSEAICKLVEIGIKAILMEEAEKQKAADSADAESAAIPENPVEAMTDAIRAAGIPAYRSYTAGQYLCNHALYLGRHLGETKFPGLKSGFIHVPLCSQQAMTTPNAHIMEIETMARGLEAAITALL